MKTLNIKEKEALKIIRKYILHKGKNPSMRELMSKLGYKSPRSASLIVDSLINKGKLRKKDDGINIVDETNDLTFANTIEIPLLGSIACGMPLLAEENIETFVNISTQFINPKSKSEYFLLRAHGDSMDKKGIKDGDIVLIKQQKEANNGDIVVALIDDDSTLKEFVQLDNAIMLKPHSTNSKHKPIIVNRDFSVQGVLVTIIGSWE